jgi:subtilisin family serine protease
MPFEVVANEVRELKAGAELIGETLVLGNSREVLQPIVSRTGILSSEFTPGIVSARFALSATLPLKKTLVASFAGYLDAHRVVKQDIWAARNVVLDASQGLTPVRIAVWDSGVDTSLFGPQLQKSGNGQATAIAYDKYSKPSRALLAPLTPDVAKRLPLMTARSKGFSDLQSNIESPEAAEVKQYLSTLTQADYRKAIEELGMIGNYEHGTHVAGIALAGNPFARLVVARLEFDYHLQPEPCPSRAQALLDAAAAKKTVAFLKAQKVRVVNMSWGGDVGGIENSMEQCGIGKTPEERKAKARELFEIQKKSLTEAFQGAPEILFIAAAGNSNNDPAFVEDVPAAIVLPNMLTVGAVDLAGDEASFTSYGSMVRVHANGYQVESTLPGGARVAMSGTSMAAPQVTNLAAKLLAVNPKLTPPEVAKIIVDTADTTADGRRHLMNPKKAIVAAKG